MGEVCYNQIGTYGLEAEREKERFTVVCPRRQGVYAKTKATATKTPFQFRVIPSCSPCTVRANYPVTGLLYAHVVVKT